MRAWPAPSVPELEQQGPVVRLRNRSGELIATRPADGTARLYVCGITPYDATHLGHASTYVAFDLLNRAWRSAGNAVHYVQNVTDVDDPLLERANQTGEDWAELAERETQLFRDDMTALRVLPPDDYIGAVESIPAVVRMIEQLREAGSVYEVDDDLYFSVHDDPAFGQVSGWTPEQMMAVFADRGGDPDRPGKKDPLDCLLWQAERPGEPAWDSSLGRGRPGWHIECSAISRNQLGTPLDVQGGGSDLAFPHHEMSAAQAQVVDGRPFAHAYVHAGMVALDGEKMSKSKGNLELVSRLRDLSVDPMQIRLALLAHHYRSDWEWTPADLERAGERLSAWRQAVLQGSQAGSGATSGELVSAVLDALAYDLDAPRALELVDQWTAGGPPDAASVAEVRDLLDATLGVVL